MLEHLEREEPAGFAKALGEPPPKEERPTAIGDVIANAVAAITGG